jgi:hypothetical protein
MFRLAIIVVLAAACVRGFTSPLVPRRSTTTTTTQRTNYPGTTVSALSLSAAQDFINRAREAAGMPPEAAAPKLFSDDLLADMQHCLLTLERRVKEGPGSLDHSDIDSFALAAARILEDMKAVQIADNRMQPGERQARAEAAAAAAAVQAEQEGKSPSEIEAIAKAALDAAFASMIPPPPEVMVAAAPPNIKSPPVTSNAPAPHIDAMGHIVTPKPAAATVSTPPPPITMTNPKPYDDNESEGPAYDGTGFGVAKGTANTYMIDGMDEMTAEEYQAALAQEVIERARKRRYGLGGAHGNRQTLDYMNSLSGGRDINPMNAPKTEDYEDNGDE